jgi:diguanylate cyclase (GGDEF)-like protein
MSAAIPAGAEAEDAVKNAIHESELTSRMRPSAPRMGPGSRLPRRLIDTLEPSIGDLEPAYRRHFLASDVEQAIFGLRCILVPSIAFAVSDYLLVGAGPAFALLLGVRTFIVALTLATIRHLRSVRQPADLDRAVVIWSLLGVVGVCCMNALRPTANTMHASVQTLSLLAVYLVIPNTLAGRLSMATLVTMLAAVVNLSGFRQHDISSSMQIWATIILTNLMGVAISSRFYTLRRQQFLGRVELERTRDNLHTIATTDGLTGLLSRRRLLELGEQDLSRAQRYERPLSVLALDLDHFKQVNDRFGHAAGDAVLVAVADVLRSQTRRHDLVGRTGGEELAVILPETGLEAAERLAERIRTQVKALRPVSDGNAISVTVSLGAAQVVPTDHSIQDLLKRADRALYTAKEHGRDCVVAR